MKPICGSLLFVNPIQLHTHIEREMLADEGKVEKSISCVMLTDAYKKTEHNGSSELPSTR